MAMPKSWIVPATLLAALLAGSGVSAAQDANSPQALRNVTTLRTTPGQPPGVLGNRNTSSGTTVTPGQILPQNSGARPLGMPEVGGGYQHMILNGQRIVVDPKSGRVISTQ